VLPCPCSPVWSHVSRAPHPSRKTPHHTTEFTQITVKTAVGFLIMGFIGFFVKLLFIVS
jgi:preprotein translocase subunit Sss1